MTKKRIADLLKEEVSKTTPIENNGEDVSTFGVVDVDAEVVKPAAEASDSEKKTTSPEAKPAKAATPKKSSRSSVTKSTLEKKVKELEASLASSQEQVASLQVDLKDHQDQIFGLKDELTKAQRTATEKETQAANLVQELDYARKTILQLTEANQKAAAEAETKAVEIAKAAAEEKAAAEKAAAEAERASRQSLSLRRAPSGYKRIPEYAIQRGPSNSMMTDDDIGWVD